MVAKGGVPVGITTAICLLLFVACAAKSAQLPLYMWLPDAMEGPTPVSALIHAATMVTAGVYLVARANPLFQVSPAALTTVAVVGAATALFAATIALAQLDIKRVLAYSTISQLGYMFMAEGAQNYTGGIFHLTTHAYFKALLFLGAGSVIHALGGEQDMRQMGGLRHRLRVTYWTFLIAALAISGIIPFAGFWSKDDIIGSLLAHAVAGGGVLFYVLWGVALLTAGLTAFYMFRLVFAVFFGSYRGSGPLAHAHGEPEDVDEEEEGHHAARGGFYAIYEAPSIMTTPLIILAILSVVGGLVGSYALFGKPGTHLFESFLSPVFTNSQWTNVAVSGSRLGFGLEWLSTGASLVLAVLGGLVAWLRYRRGFDYKESANPAYQLVLHKYYIDELCTAVIINPLLWLGRTATSLLEGSLLHWLGDAWSERWPAPAANGLHAQLCPRHSLRRCSARHLLRCHEGVEGCFHCYRRLYSCPCWGASSCCCCRSVPRGSYAALPWARPCSICCLSLPCCCSMLRPISRPAVRSLARLLVARFWRRSVKM
jgi:NADH-quinone oxidoreductase subunit L